MPATSAGGLLLSTALAVVVVGGLEAVAFGLLPLRFLAGDAVYRWRRLLWALLFGISAFFFIHLLVGPHTGYLSELSPAAIVAAFGRSPPSAPSRCCSGLTSASGRRRVAASG